MNRCSSISTVLVMILLVVSLSRSYRQAALKVIVRGSGETGTLPLTVGTRTAAAFSGGKACSRLEDTSL